MTPDWSEFAVVKKSKFQTRFIHIVHDFEPFSAAYVYLKIAIIPY